MFRPAALGRSPAYALSDPGHEYLPGGAEVWLGPLAAEWGVRGQRATLPARENLYRHRTPDGSADLLPHVDLGRYRPVHGGVFHASKSLDAHLAGQPPEVRARAKAVFARCAAEVYEEQVAPDLRARTKKGGTQSVPVKTCAAVFAHETNAAGYYHLHAHLEVHNAGRSADGKYRAVDNAPLFHNQRLYGVAFEAKLVAALRRELGLPTRPSPTGPVVDGFGPLRGVRTPRQEQIDAWLKAKGLPRTPKSLAAAARATHARRDPALTVRAAARRTLEWLAAKGLGALRAAAAKAEASSALREDVRAFAAVRAAARWSRRRAAT